MGARCCPSMRQDGRVLNAAVKEAIRRMAVARVEEGERPRAVARSFGYNRSSVYPWLHAAREQGTEALAARKQPGRPHQLAKEQEARVGELLEGKMPEDYGLQGRLWTRALVGEVVRQRFDVHLSPPSIGRLLHRQGLSFQRPVRRAYERDPQAVKNWKEEILPTLRQRARKEGKDLFFQDETGVRDDVAPERTWAPKGRRPEVRVRSRRESINAISAIDPHGAFWFRLYGGSLDAKKFAIFLLEFLLTRDRPVMLVLDKHPAHTARPLLEFVEKLQGRLELHFLPAYAPDTNPDEFVWSHLKKNGLARHPLRKDERLAERVHRHLTRMQSDPRLIRSFFHAPNVGDFSDYY
jgi:transposase